MSNSKTIKRALNNPEFMEYWEYSGLGRINQSQLLIDWIMTISYDAWVCGWTSGYEYIESINED